MRRRSAGANGGRRKPRATSRRRRPTLLIDPAGRAPDEPDGYAPRAMALAVETVERARRLLGA